MRGTWQCRALVVVAVAMYAVGFAAEAWVVYPGWVHPWWAQLLRGPVWSSAAAVPALGAIMWWVVAAIPRMFDSGVAHGMRLCERTHRDAQVIPLQVRRANAELS